MNYQADHKESVTEDQLRQWIADLGNKNGLTRRQAREALQRAGKVATPYLIKLFESDDAIIRWEATKALIHIADPKAAPALVKTLMDESFEVQWLAAEALIELGREALEPLLEGLMHNYGSVYMRQGVHHVLHDLERRHLLGPPSIRVLEELRCIEPVEPYPVTARRALRELAANNNDGLEARAD